MLLDTKKAIEVFTKVQEIQREYKARVLGAPENRVSVEDLQLIIEDLCQLKIEKREVAFEGDFVRGLVERYKDKAIIRVRRDMSDDWKRFTAVKEMCHVVIDEPDDWSVAGVDTLEDLQVEFSVENDAQAQRATQSEVFAEIAAMELLYPFDNRPADSEKLQASEITITAIATHHDLPPVFVSRAQTERYRNFAKKIWKSVGS